jgi:hypothetical protein
MKSSLLAVPHGTEPARCKACGTTIYFVRTKRLKLIPVDCTARSYGPGVRAPTTIADGYGVAHFATCPMAAQFRRMKGD